MSFACRPNWSVGVVSLAAIPATVDSESVGGTTVADVSLGTDGTGAYDAASASTPFNWFAPTSSGIGANYWCRMTLNSGTALGGSATGSILALSSARAWSLTRSSLGLNTANVTLEIFSDAGGVTVVASRTFTMSAVVS